MPDGGRPEVAVVDYGMGNLFSVKHACAAVGLAAEVTCSRAAVLAADAVILPGVGAFGDAMASLEALDLVTALQAVVADQKPLFGICLGMQLLMTESFEFGRHRGLGFIEGDVVRFVSRNDGSRLKVPHIGWDRVVRPEGAPEVGTSDDPWSGGYLEGLDIGTFMYFVHSYYARPADPLTVVATSRYGETEFCASLRSGRIFGTQFHPERSGRQGLHVYARFADAVRAATSLPGA